ncbi:unnamed protein product, partial [marine sediment metagenome]
MTAAQRGRGTGMGKTRTLSFGIGREVAAALIAVIYFAGLWASPLGGHLSDRLGRVPVLLTVCFMTGPVIYLLNLVPYGLGFGAMLL